MKVQIKSGFVKINDCDYFHPSLVSLDGRYAEVICGLSSSRVDVYWHGKFYCEAAYVPASESALSPMRPAEKGRFEREFGRRMRQPARYPMIDEFPPMPEAYRCRSAICSDDSLWREMRRAACGYDRLRLATAGIGNQMQRRAITAALRGLKNTLEELTRLLGEESVHGEF